MLKSIMRNQCPNMLQVPVPTLGVHLDYDWRFSLGFAIMYSTARSEVKKKRFCYSQSYELTDPTTPLRGPQ